MSRPRPEGDARRLLDASREIENVAGRLHEDDLPQKIKAVVALPRRADELPPEDDWQIPREEKKKEVADVLHQELADALHQELELVTRLEKNAIRTKRMTLMMQPRSAVVSKFQPPHTARIPPSNDRRLGVP